ncbi:alpha amylase N-terminal ig-like domain-containing protein [Escherichia coli]|nr:alpha amylase N-terminal ig-like domain-containing protein [Escherichia coli]
MPTAKTHRSALCCVQNTITKKCQYRCISSAVSSSLATAWRAAIDLSSGQPRRRYSFKLLWHDRQRWFTPQGFSRNAAGTTGAVCRRCTGYRPHRAADQILSIFPDRFARSLPREAEQDHVYYHHAAGQEIILRDRDEMVTAQAGGSTFYGGDLDG